jgi:hypothetical protein
MQPTFGADLTIVGISLAFRPVPTHTPDVFQRRLAQRVCMKLDVFAHVNDLNCMVL